MTMRGISWTVGPFSLWFLLIFMSGCDVTATPVPYMRDQTVETQTVCQTDFSSQQGKCLAVVRGEEAVREYLALCEEEDGACGDSWSCDEIHSDRVVCSCQLYEPALSNGCVEHFTLDKRHSKPYFTHVNLPAPCFAPWIQEEYDNENSDYYHSGLYRVVSLDLASDVVEDNVHLIEYLYPEEFMIEGTCLYSVSGILVELVQGSYTVTLWTNDREPVFETSYDN